ncbi:hypothetical protein FFLO_03382 [Filobasidium floriforme]|uniref:Uncharacterized protein n=1 Tax=Filobasidium floriforme TaxID=5210 RepID=A0A8K0JLI7_9TREE|nr:hypothetical protein FFLO_03382 [Filobasidium floriforme]
MNPLANFNEATQKQSFEHMAGFFLSQPATFALPPKPSSVPAPPPLATIVSIPPPYIAPPALPTMKATFNGRGSGKLNGEERGFFLGFAQHSFKHSFVCNLIHLGYEKKGSRWSRAVWSQLMAEEPAAVKVIS